ncbi:hypothetical protein Hdeb2414_s0600g00922521 [Helianthus debilis subsp. tardiflorus]
MAASSSMNSGSIAVSMQITAPISAVSTVSTPLSSGAGTSLPFVLIPTSQESEFDAEFLSKNATLLRRLKAQQARDEQILGLRIRLFQDATPVLSGPSPAIMIRSAPQLEVVNDPDLTKPYHPVSMTAKSKFSARITHAKLPPKLKMPTTVKKYDGTTDPDDHMFDFDGAARVEQWPMPAWCFMFAQTLTGVARVWFDALSEGEINDFEEF